MRQQSLLVMGNAVALQTEPATLRCFGIPLLGRHCSKTRPHSLHIEKSDATILIGCLSYFKLGPSTGGRLRLETQLWPVARQSRTEAWPGSGA